MITRMCTACGRAKPLADFYRTSQNSNGHASACKDCKRAASRNYYRAHQPREVARKDEYRRTHRDEMAAYSRAFPHRRWLAAYRERCRLYGLVPTVERFTRDDLVEQHGDLCVYCGGPFECTDHVLAVGAGGPHTLANIVPCCEPCNLLKLHAIDLRLIRLTRSGIVLPETYELVAA